MRALFLLLVALSWVPIAPATGEFFSVAFATAGGLSQVKGTASRPLKSSVFPLAANVARFEQGVEVEQTRESWHYYEQSTLQRKYERAGGIVYKQSVLSADEYAVIRDIISSSLGSEIRLNDETTSSVATKRVGAQLRPENDIVRILGAENGIISQFVNSLVCKKKRGTSRKMVLSKDVPVEVRIYERTGAGMDWHVDDVLFDPEQVEVVFTVENNSDCVTMWEEPVLGTSPLEYRRVEVETAGNSAIFLKAGGVRHRVSPLRTGRRIILKFVYVYEGSDFLDSAEQHVKQFMPAGQRRNQKSNSKNGGKKSRKGKRR